MHRVELKVETFSYQFQHLLNVPNAPCGVESLNAVNEIDPVLCS